MASLRDQFGHYYAPDEDAVKTAIQEGLVVPDTNVLLNLYRYQTDARDELFGALEKLGNRLWAPYQVGLEFHRNRLKVIAEHDAYFSQMEKEFNATLNVLREKVRAFRSRIAVSPGAVKQVEDEIQGLQTLLENIMNWASDGSLLPDDHATDEVLTRVDALFPDGRVGDPMEPGELEEARKEAERRRADSIPPGYMDRKKDDPAGDYLIWAQLKVEAAKRKDPVVFITDDTKEDFYEVYKGKTIGARRELREEMMDDSGVPMIFMTTGTFLHHAGQYLDATVSPETVDQARELGDGSKSGFRIAPAFAHLAEGKEDENIILADLLARQAHRPPWLRTLDGIPDGSFRSVLQIAYKYDLDLASDSWVRLVAQRFPSLSAGVAPFMVDSPQARSATLQYLAGRATDKIESGQLTDEEAMSLLGMWQAIAEASESQDGQVGSEE